MFDIITSSSKETKEKLINEVTQILNQIRESLNRATNKKEEYKYKIENLEIWDINNKF